MGGQLLQAIGSGGRRLAIAKHVRSLPVWYTPIQPFVTLPVPDEPGTFRHGTPGEPWPTRGRLIRRPQVCYINMPLVGNSPALTDAGQTVPYDLSSARPGRTWVCSTNTDTLPIPLGAIYPGPDAATVASIQSAGGQSVSGVGTDFLYILVSTPVAGIFTDAHWTNALAALEAGYAANRAAGLASVGLLLPILPRLGYRLFISNQTLPTTAPKTAYQTRYAAILQEAVADLQRLGVDATYVGTDADATHDRLVGLIADHFGFAV